MESGESQRSPVRNAINNGKDKFFQLGKREELTSPERCGRCANSVLDNIGLVAVSSSIECGSEKAGLVFHVSLSSCSICRYPAAGKSKATFKSIRKASSGGLAG